MGLDLDLFPLLVEGTNSSSLSLDLALALVDLGVGIVTTDVDLDLDLGLSVSTVSESLLSLDLSEFTSWSFSPQSSSAPLESESSIDSNNFLAWSLVRRLTRSGGGSTGLVGVSMFLFILETQRKRLVLSQKRLQNMRELDISSPVFLLFVRKQNSNLKLWIGKAVKQNLSGPMNRSLVKMSLICRPMYRSSAQKELKIYAFASMYNAYPTISRW